MRKRRERIYVYVVPVGAAFFEDLIDLFFGITELILKIPRKYKLAFLGCMSIYLGCVLKLYPQHNASNGEHG